MVLCIVILLLLAALLMPYGTTLLLKHRMLRRLEKVCRQCGFRMKRLYPSLLFVRNRSRRYDLLLESKEQILAVKLWSAPRRGNTLVIAKDGRVFEQGRALLPMDVRRENRDLLGKGVRRSVPRTRWELPKNEKRSVTNVLLQYPAYREVLAQTEKGQIRLESGSPIFDKLLYSPSALESLLRRGEGAKERETVSNRAKKA